MEIFIKINFFSTCIVCYYSILLKFFSATESRSIINVHMHDELTQERLTPYKSYARLPMARSHKILMKWNATDKQKKSESRRKDETSHCKWESAPEKESQREREWENEQCATIMAANKTIKRKTEQRRKIKRQMKNANERIIEESKVTA